MKNKLPFSFLLLLAIEVTATAAPAPPTPPGIGIMYLTKSNALGDPPPDLASNPCWKNALVHGVALRTQWSKLQPTEAAFDWSYLDQGMALAKTYGKKVSILITAGVTTPAWVYAVGAKKFNVTAVSGPVLPMPLPWDPVFQEKWGNVIRTFAARYGSNAQLVYVVMGGSGRKAESFFVTTPEDQAALAALGGLTSWKAGVEWIVDQYAKYFTTTPFLLDLGAPVPTAEGRTALSDVCAYAVKKYPRRFGVKSDGLAANYGTDTFGATEIKLLSPTTTVGFQMTLPMKGRKDSNGNLLLGDALTLGISLGAHFIEVYSVDCDDSTNARILKDASAQLLKSVPPPSAAKPDDAAPIQLSVFEVSADKDLGYAASTTMSGTRTSEKLENLPNAISVMNADFLADLGLLNFLDAVEYGVGTENIYNDSGTRGAAIGTRSGNQISFRGLSSARQLRDGFPWYMPEDAFNIERIEFSRGPGGLSYGDVDAGGTVNVSTKRATFRRQDTTVSTRWDSFGGRRAAVDYQRALVSDRLALRLNGVFNDGEGARQRTGSDIKAIAAALRWQVAPRTVLDVTFERGNQRDGLSHGILTDEAAAYVRGTGTNALDAIPSLAGVQTDGVGQSQSRAAGANQLWTLIDGTMYNLESTKTAVFRNSHVIVNPAVSSLVTNPALIPEGGIPESIVPRYQDWFGPDNYADQRWHTYTVELRHEITDRFRLLFALNSQRDTVVRPAIMFGNQDAFGGRAVYIDVTPNHPDPTDPAGLRLIPNPRYEQYYVVHEVQQVNDGHGINNYRSVAVYDAQLPLGITQRLVASVGYRTEQYAKDVFFEDLTAGEIARAGLTGSAANFGNNHVSRYHYLSDGNSDAALRDPAIPGVTTFARQDSDPKNSRFDQSLLNVAFNALGSYFNGRVHTSLGLSRDRWHQSIAHVGTNAAAGNIVAFLDANNQPIPEGGSIPTFDFTTQWVTNKSYGAVVRVLPWLSLTGAWLESTQFTDNYGVDLNGRPLLGLRGEGTDLGVRLNFLNGRINLSYVRFDTTSTNDSVGLGGVPSNELNPFLATPFFNNIDYRDQRSRGDEVEFFFSPTPNWTGRMSYSSSQVTLTNFFPLLKVKLAEAQATAAARGLDPIEVTALTLQTMSDASDQATKAGRHSANATTRYMFTQGPLKGLALGGVARYIEGGSRSAVIIGGMEAIPETKIPDDWIVGTFVTYRRAFGRVKWTAQLNVNNLFDRVTAKGSYRNGRYSPDPRQFVLSNSFAF